MKGRASERAEENPGAALRQGRSVGQDARQPIRKPPHLPSEPARLLDVEAGTETVEDRARPDQVGHGALGGRLHEKVVLVCVRPDQQGAEKAEDEDGGSAVGAVGRERREVDEDLQTLPGGHAVTLAQWRP